MRHIAAAFAFLLRSASTGASAAPEDGNKGAQLRGLKGPPPDNDKIPGHFDQKGPCYAPDPTNPDFIPKVQPPGWVPKNCEGTPIPFPGRHPADAGGRGSRPPESSKENQPVLSSVPEGCVTDYPSWIADGYCDPSLNTKECGFDGGDCCEDTCTDGSRYSCGHNGYNCKITCPSNHKNVRITDFKINDGDLDAGTEAEMTMYVGRDLYYPSYTTDRWYTCTRNSLGYGTGEFSGKSYCEFTENRQYSGLDLPVVLVPGFESFSLNIHEHDPSSAILGNDRDDHYGDTWSASIWHLEGTCRAYKVQFSIPTKPGETKEECWEVSAEIEAEYQGVGGGVGGAYTKCSTWESPAGSLIIGAKVTTPGHDDFGVAQYCGGGELGEGPYYGVCANGGCCSQYVRKL